MNRLLLLCFLVLEAFLVVIPLPAQSELVKSDFYPADLEFPELGNVGLQRAGTEGKQLQGLSEAPLLVEAGFKRYDTRTYALLAGGSLKIEFIELKDERAAFSLLTLLRNSPMQHGPPGDTWAEMVNGLIFAQDNVFVRLTGPVSADLLQRIAGSINNRIGRRSVSAPLLVSHFPSKGYDPASLRYFLGPRAVEAHGGSNGMILPFRPEMELAQARYILPTGTGTFWLASFPTSQLAEDYLEAIAVLRDHAAKKQSPAYAKRTGPLVGCIEGNIDPVSARELLDSLQYSYSIKWIYDKDNHAAKTLWGVPVVILSTVVRSLLFTTLLGLASIVIGVGTALFRLVLRTYAPHNYLDRPERNEMIRLKLNEY